MRAGLAGANNPAVKPLSPPTIKDVARAAQVHYSTVSLALRDHPSIPAKTRERIRRAAERVGYQRNPVLGALSRFRRGVSAAQPVPRLAYLVNRSPELGFHQLLYQQHFLAGAREQATALGYELELLFVAEDHHDSESLTAYLRAAGITGLVIGAFEPGFADLLLDWEQFSVVKIDSRHIAPDVDVVSNDQLQVVRLAYQRLSALGYRRIGMAVGRSDEESTDHRHAMGYLIEQSTIDPKHRVPPLLFPHNCDAATVSGLIGRWARRNQVDAVLCNWFNILELLKDAGFRVPDEMGCACLCLLEPRPQLAGVVPNLRIVGANAVAVLASLMRTGERGIPEIATTTYVPSLWQEGASAPLRG